MPTSKVLGFTATKGYRHDSIEDAIALLKSRQSDLGIEFHFTENGNDFTESNLGQYDAVMFISPMGEVLSEEQHQAFRTYIRKGGNYMGVHSAACVSYSSEAYGKLVGAHFDYHPELQPATFLVLDKSHPSTSHLSDSWHFEEEVYMFRSDPRDNGVNVLISVDEDSYKDEDKSTGDYPGHGNPHPIAWYNDKIVSDDDLLSPATESGRSFYTSLGHSPSSKSASATGDVADIVAWKDEVFIKHIFGGLQWVLESGSRPA